MSEFSASGGIDAQGKQIKGGIHKKRSSNLVQVEQHVSGLRDNRHSRMAQAAARQCTGGNHAQAASADSGPAQAGSLMSSSSFIRTLTVGSGVSPDLLTPGQAGALAGSACNRPYRRWGISPRPEDAGHRQMPVTCPQYNAPRRLANRTAPASMPLCLAAKWARILPLPFIHSESDCLLS